MRWTSFSIALISATLALATPAVAQMPLAPGEIARVGDQPVLKADFDHWLVIARKVGFLEEEALRAQVMQLLISFKWIEGEAALQGIVVRSAAVNAAYRKQKRVSFPRERDFRRFLRTSGQTVADVKRRVRQDLLSQRISKRVVGDAKTAEGQWRRLDRFIVDFTARWRAVTVCGEGFTSGDDCGTVVPLST